MTMFNAVFALALVAASPATAPESSKSSGSSDAQEEWTPAPAPPPTAWVLAGARGWRLCDDVGRQALAQRVAGRPGARGQGGEGLVWSKRAKQCPNQPEVLVLAAQEQIVEISRISWGPDVATGLQEVVDEHRARIDQAREWLATALAESKLRGQVDPLEVHDLQAYVAFAGGELEASRRELDRALALGDVERWRAERMAAMLHLLLGDVETSMRLAHRAVIDAPAGSDRMISAYIFALVLDRVGDPAAARESLRSLRREAGHTAARQAVESVLPIHERLYLRAVDHQANRERSNAVRLWEAYLSRPEPHDADKELARRHQAQLQVRPPPVGGPMR